MAHNCRAVTTNLQKPFITLICYCDLKNWHTSICVNRIAAVAMLCWSLNKFALIKTRPFFITLKDIATTKYHIFQNTFIYYSEIYSWIGTPVFYFPLRSPEN